MHGDGRPARAARLREGKFAGNATPCGSTRPVPPKELFLPDIDPHWSVASRRLPPPESAHATRTRDLGLPAKAVLTERAISDLALRSRTRAEFRRELATLLGRTLHFDQLILGAERDRSEPLTAHAGAPRERATPRPPGGTPPVSWHWRSAIGSHWLEVVCAQGVSDEECATWLALLPAIKLAEAHWLAVESLRSVGPRRVAERPSEPQERTAAPVEPSTVSPTSADHSGPSRTYVNAVRDALRHLHEVSRLSSNPLIDSRVVAARFVVGAAEGGRVRALQQVLTELVRDLGNQSTTIFWHRALHHTYVSPADTQLRAAELSRTSYGSYRRFVSRGVSEVAMRLWMLERAAELRET
jgi:hypothetical protein